MAGGHTNHHTRTAAQFMPSGNQRPGLGGKLRELRWEKASAYVSLELVKDVKVVFGRLLISLIEHMVSLHELKVQVAKSMLVQSKGFGKPRRCAQRWDELYRCPLNV